MTNDAPHRPDSQSPPRAVPAIGWVAKNFTRQAIMVFLGLLVVAAGVAVAVKTWGLVALTFAALCLVPMVFAFFIVISWPHSADK